MRAILLFVGIAVLSAALMIASVLEALPVAFATQGGQGGFGGILLLSVAYGLLGLAVRWAWRVIAAEQRH